MDQHIDHEIESKLLSSRYARSVHSWNGFVGRHLRSVKHYALIKTLKAARGARFTRNYVTQRQLVDHLGLRQAGYGMMETGQRRVDVLEFIDIGDALSKDRLALFRALIKLCPRRVQPVRRTAKWRAETTKKVSKRRKLGRVVQGGVRSGTVKQRRVAKPRHR